MPRQNVQVQLMLKACHVGGNSLWSRSQGEENPPHKKLWTLLLQLLKGFRFPAAVLCHNLQVGKGRVLFFFLQKIIKQQSISVPELFPEMRAPESPGNSLFSVSSLGKGLFPKGSVIHGLENMVQHRMHQMFGQRFPPSLCQLEEKTCFHWTFFQACC